MFDEIKFKIDKKELNSFIGINNDNYNSYQEVREVLKSNGILLTFNTSYNTFNMKCIKGWNYSLVIKINEVRVLKDKNLIIVFKLFGIEISQYISIKYTNKEILNNLVVNNIFKGFVNEFGIQLTKLL